MRKVKIGIIGCGVISNTYILNIKSMFGWLEIVACADILVNKAKETAEKYSIPKGLSVEELLKDPEVIVTESRFFWRTGKNLPQRESDRFPRSLWRKRTALFYCL